MVRYREMIGSSYRVLFRDSTSAEVRCDFLCPYCEQMMSATLTAYPSNYNLIDNEGFFDNLACSSCGKVAKVRFHPSQKV